MEWEDEEEGEEEEGGRGGGVHHWPSVWVIGAFHVPLPFPRSMVCMNLRSQHHGKHAAIGMRAAGRCATRLPAGRRPDARVTAWHIDALT